MLTILDCLECSKWYSYVCIIAAIYSADEGIFDLSLYISCPLYHRNGFNHLSWGVREDKFFVNKSVCVKIHYGAIQPALCTLDLPMFHHYYNTHHCWSDA